MEIFGVGTWELVAILILMLIVAGPKRMIQWSYVLGTYLSKVRKMWVEAASVLQNEFDKAGVDVNVPKDIPTRHDLQQEAGRIVTKYGRPIAEPLEEIQKDMATMRENSRVLKSQGDVKSYKPVTPAKKSSNPPAENAPSTPYLGTWSTAESDSASEPNAPSESEGHFGTWSSGS